VCLDGRILLWDVDASGAATLAATVDGTQGPLTCLACDAATGALIQAGGDGFIAATWPDQAPRKAKVGKSIQHILAHGPGFAGPPEAWVFALDDCARNLSLEGCVFSGEPVAIKEFVVGVAWLDQQETRAIIAGGKNSFHCLGAGGLEWTKPDAVSRRPTSIATSPGTGRMAIALERPEGMVSAGVQNSQFDIHLFNIGDAGSADGITPGNVLQGHLKEVTAMKFNPAGDLLASADSGNKIMVWSCSADGTATLAIAEWVLHTARVTCLDWLAGGRRLVSGSLDQLVYVWDADKPSDKIKIAEAHKAGVSAVVSCGEKSFASVGNDGFLRVYQID